MNTISNFRIGEKIRSLLSHAVHIAFLAYVGAMAWAVYQLGGFYGQHEIYRLLVSGACAIGLLGHGAAVTRPTTNTSRTMHGLALGTWAILSLFLASLYMATTSTRLRAALPADMVNVGEWVYALAFAIGIATSLSALVLPSVAERPATDDAIKTIGQVITRYGENVAILLAVAVSSFHIYQFGMNVAKADLFSIAAAMVMADLAFVVAEKRVVSELRERRETGRMDALDLVLWGLFALGVLGYLILVNLFAIRHSSGTLNVEDPLYRLTVDFYGVSATVLLAALAALSIITALFDFKVGDGQASASDWAIRKVGGARSTLDGIRAAWNQPSLPSHNSQTNSVPTLQLEKEVSDPK